MAPAGRTCRRIVIAAVVCLLFHCLARNIDLRYAQWLAHLCFALISLWISWQIAEVFVMAKKVDPYNKVVVITGCDTGFGNKLAAKLDELGFTVVAGCLDPESNGARRLTSNCSERLRVIALDVTLDGSVDEALEEVKKLLPEPKSLWGIVNNAGIGHYAGIDWGPPGVEEVYRRQLQVNTLGLVRVTKTFLPLLRRRANSRVVLISSMSARFVFPGLTGYSMSKFAVRAFGDGLRRELSAHSVHVSIIEPMMYDTNITDERTCLSLLEDHWSTSPKDLREELGSHRFSNLYNTVANFLMMKRKNINEVVDTVIDCLLEEEPKSYCQVGGFLEKLSLYLLEYLPEEIQDFFLDGALYNRALKLIHSSR